ncbi:MAG: nucleoporin-interacting protein NIC96 [Amphiamblys sp. WSBS2006]|nr:MAG: nucleoporin-interacting protein NIC96 [Amphiamblys sp. WSBS2006]
MVQRGDELAAEAKLIAVEYILEAGKLEKDGRPPKWAVPLAEQCLSQLYDGYAKLAAKHGRFIERKEGDTVIVAPRREEQRKYLSADEYLQRKHVELVEAAIEATRSPVVPDGMEQDRGLFSEHQKVQWGEDSDAFYFAAVQQVLSQWGEKIEEDDGALFVQAVLGHIESTRGSVLVDTWRLLGEICSESKKTGKRVVTMRVFLEKQFLSFIKRTVSETPHAQVLSGLPNVIEQVSVFCSIKQRGADVETVDGVPQWMVLFYLVRCGKWAESVEYTHEIDVKDGDKALAAQVREYCTAQAHPSGETRKGLCLEYERRKLLSRQDPFKLALLKIVGRCDIEKKTMNEILPATEDYLWLQTHLAVEGDEEYSFADLQETVRSQSSSSFGGQDSALLHFQALCMCRLFDEAFGSLGDGYRVHGVHFGIALLLGGCLDGKAQQRASDNLFGYGESRVQYGREKEALFYGLVGCRALAGCVERLGDILLGTKSTSGWFGAYRAGGVFEGGYLSQYVGVFGEDGERVLESLAGYCAEKKKEGGERREALRLYDRARKYTTAFSALSDFLSVDIRSPFSEEHSEETISLAISLFEFYTQTASISELLPQESVSTAQMLIRLYQFVREANRGEWESALELLSGVGVIPLTRGEAAQCSEVLGLLPECVMQTSSVLVDCAIRCIDGVYRSMPLAYRGSPETGELSEKTMALVIFATQIPFTISEDVFQKLNALSTMLGC